MDQSLISKYRKAKQINPLSQKELSYIAGFIDAKGSITCTKTRKSVLWRIRVSAINAAHAKMLHNLIGIGRLSNNKRHIITIGLKESITLINNIIKYSSIKRNQLLSMLEYTNLQITGQNIDTNYYVEQLSKLNQSKIGYYPSIDNMDEYTGYISGLWDGNGTCFVKNKKLIIGIYNTVIEPLNYLNESIDSQVIELKKRIQKHSSIYMLKITNKKAIDWFYNNLFGNSDKAKNMYKLYKKSLSSS